MDAASFQRMMALFDAACDLSRAEQAELVAQLTSREPELGARLDKLLRHDASQTEVLGPGAGARALVEQLGDASETGSQTASQTVAASARRRREGELVGGYQVGAWLGQGSMGSVHHGREVATGRAVAIKFLKGETGGVGEQRLRREYEVLGRLDHPNCVKVFAHGRSAQGHFLVMDYVAGGDLAARLGRRGLDELRILARVADALAHIHGHGVVHRDLKPANVLLTAEALPQPKLVDFGIARTPDATTLLTGSKEVLGSLDFLAPEQCRGEPAEARSDLYALGCLIYVLWTGGAPFGGDNIERLAARMSGRPRRLDELVAGTPVGLGRLVHELMAPRPEERPTNATVVAATLRALGGDG